VILDTGFQASLFQSFAPAGWMLDVSGFHHRCVPGYPVSSIKHSALSRHTEALINTLNESMNGFAMLGFILQDALIYEHKMFFAELMFLLGSKSRGLMKLSSSILYFKKVVYFFDAVYRRGYFSGLFFLRLGVDSSRQRDSAFKGVDRYGKALQNRFIKEFGLDFRCNGGIVHHLSGGSARRRLAGAGDEKKPETNEHDTHFLEIFQF